MGGGQTEGSRTIAPGVVETTSGKYPILRTLLASFGGGLAVLLEGTLSPGSISRVDRL